MGAIQNDWLGPLSPEFKKPYYKELYNFVREEYSKTTFIKALLNGEMDDVERSEYIKKFKLKN